MSFKDLLVTVDGDSDDQSPLALAAWLAGRFQAHLVGLHPSSTAKASLYSANFGTELFDDAMRETFAVLERRAVDARTGLDTAARRNGIQAEWRVARGFPGPETVLNGRTADLVILGQRWSDYDGLRYPDPADVVLDVGCPVLVVPRAGRFERIERHALVAWNGSREAARAVRDALPLLKRVAKVTVLAVNAGGGGEEPGADIALHLARHGIRVEIDQSTAPDMKVADVLLSHASDRGSDLIVMGAYGHARMRETILGGVTRSMLEQMTVPVLMSH
ncbi:MAG TPA: universal stress protein [Aliidongia sp.]|uniref:universal stress protein n=1 Tax=Aliidongia sp. TaxID=1914230 RepID=UPI002DDDA17B|nr:universal stress protein [Aliidongia sp.]HEV2675366.1 universal stress protein [Aliidongia sp.]